MGILRRKREFGVKNDLRGAQIWAEKSIIIKAEEKFCPEKSIIIKAKKIFGNFRSPKILKGRGYY